jgi:hypothetical protein
MTEVKITEEHLEMLASQCNQLVYSRPCTTAYCIKRGKLLADGKATCMILEIYHALRKVMNDDLRRMYTRKKSDVHTTPCSWKQ